jgi:hypothetical protein
MFFVGNALSQPNNYETISKIVDTYFIYEIFKLLELKDNRLTKEILYVFEIVVKSCKEDTLAYVIY